MGINVREQTLFRDNAQDFTGRPVKSDYALALDEYTRYNDPHLQGHFIGSNLTSAEISPSGDVAKKLLAQYASAMNAIQGLQTPLAFTLKKFVNVLDTIERLSEGCGKEWDAHIQAGKDVVVNKNDVFMIDGKVGTRAQLAVFNATLGGDSQLKTIEDLVVDENGVPLMDAAGTHYYDKEAYERLNGSIDNAQEKSQLIERLEALRKGEITFDDFTQDEIKQLIANQPEDIRNKIYKEMGFDEQQIAKVEALLPQAEATKSGPWLANPDQQPVITLNEGTLTPGMLASQFFDAAGNLKQDPAIPAYELTYTPSGPAPAPSGG